MARYSPLMVLCMKQFCDFICCCDRGRLLESVFSVLSWGLTCRDLEGTESVVRSREMNGGEVFLI